jgi:predicted MFS family arabinose efflux permease
LVSSVSSVMESPGYRRLLYSAAAVIFGVMGQAVARGWLARDLTGSNAGLGGVMLAFGVAMLIATPWGGVAADRFPKRSVLLAAVSMLALSSSIVGVAVVADVIEYWMLVLASAIQAVAFALYLPARIAFIAEVVEPQDIAAAVTLSQTTQEAMRVVAPALAGVLIGLSWFGVGGVFLLAAGTSVVAGIVLIGLPPGSPRARSTRSPIAEMLDAVRYVRARRGLGLVALTTIGVVVIGFPYLTFLPTLADERFGVGAGGYGVMSGVAGLGAVVAGVVAPRRRWVVQRPWATVAASGAALGVSLIALGLAGSFWLALAALLAVGAGGLIFQTTTQSLMLSLSDVDYHGRMQSMVVLGFSGFGLAALPLGLLADATTLGVTLVAMGVMVLILTFAFALKRGQHRRALVAVEFA